MEQIKKVRRTAPDTYARTFIELDEQVEARRG